MKQGVFNAHSNLSFSLCSQEKDALTGTPLAHSYLPTLYGFLKGISLMKLCISFTCHSHTYPIKGIDTGRQRHVETHRKKVRKTERGVCLLYQLVVARPEQKAQFFCHTILLAGYFWCPGGGEGWKTSHKGKNVVPVVVLGGHGRVDVGVGCLPFHIGWPLGCMSQGLLWEEGWSEGKMGVYRQKLKGSEGWVMFWEQTIQRMPPRYNPA